MPPRPMKVYKSLFKLKGVWHMLKLDAALWEKIIQRINDETTGKYAERKGIDRSRDM